jgi:hypothetical protein
MLMSAERPPTRFSVLVNRAARAGLDLGRTVKTSIRLVETEAEPIAGLAPVTGIAAGRDRELAMAKARVRWLALVEQVHGLEAADLAKARFRSYRVETDGEGYLCLFRATPVIG